MSISGRGKVQVLNVEAGVVTMMDNAACIFRAGY
jgi:hypothetical protein